MDIVILFMDFANFEFIQILKQEHMNLRDIQHLCTLNKKLKRSLLSIYGCNHYIIASFDSWKTYTRKVIVDKKYKRRSSWYKKPRHEEMELLCF